MKRIVLGISALATVLSLGIFAIAWGQRGSEEQTSNESFTTASDTAAPSGQPQLLPSDARANPLRSPKRTFPTNGIRTAAVAPEDSPVRTTSRPSVALTSDSAVSRSGVEEKHLSPSSPTAPVDPFGLRTRSDVAASRTLGLTAKTSDPAEQTVAAAPPSTDATGPTAAAGPSLRAATPLRPSPLRDQLDTSNPMAAVAAASPTAVKKEDPPSSQLPSSYGAGSLRPSATDLASKPFKESMPAAPLAGRSSSPSLPASSPTTEPALLHPGSGSISPVPRTAGDDEGLRRPVAAEPRARTPIHAEDSRAGEGTGKPGAKQIEGPQAPQVTLQKTAPSEIQVGRPATFQIKLKNTGPIAARNVEIRDVVPKGTRLISTSPQANPGVQGELVWQLGTLKPTDEVTLEIQVMPVDEGEIGSVATVSFSADVSARTIATKPQLVLKTVAPSKVLIGEDVNLSITVTNTGSGVAHKVVLDERVPAGLQHVAGPELEYEVGDLKPNESRQLDLKVTAVQPGATTNVLLARGDVNVKAEDRWTVEVLAPQLDLAMEGPKRRFLDREASYVFSVSNPGTAPARQVELVAQLPPGLKYVRANNSGQYDDTTRSVRWLLEELPVKETGTVELTTMPVDIGEQTLRLRGSAERGLASEKEHPVIIDGIAAAMFQVADAHDPLEVNGETTYEIHVLNQGSKASTNVQISLELPADLRFAAAEGPTRFTAGGSRVVFEPLPRLAAKADTTYRVRVQGLKPGDQRVRVQMLTDEIRVPITKEESTTVYSDN